jgi:hypothetical protein
MAGEIEADPGPLDGEIRKAEKRLGNLLELAADTGEKSLLEKIRATQGIIDSLRQQKNDWIERATLKQRLLAIDEKDITFALYTSGQGISSGEGYLDDVLSVFGFGEHMRFSREEMRKVLTTLVERIELEPSSREFSIRYRIPVTGVKMASPRGFEPRLPP